MKFIFDTKTKIFILCSLVFFLNNTIVVAQEKNVDSLNAQKNDVQKRLEDINKQIKNYQSLIITTQAKSSSLKNEVLIYDNQISSTELQIQAKETQIEDVNLQIGELDKIIKQKITEIADNRVILGRLIVELYEFDNQYALKTTIGSGNLSQFLDQIQYTQSLQEKVYQLQQKIKDLKARLEEQQHNLKIQLEKLEQFKKELELTKQSLGTQRNQKQILLTQTKGVEKNFQKLLSTSKTQEEDLQKEVNDLDAQIRAKLGKKTILSSKGVLAYPMDGILTQKYGNTGFTSLGYNFHNGIDIAAPAAQPLYASADGTILYTDSSDQTYGNWVAIKHSLNTKKGNIQIITLYAHMRKFLVSSGQKVSQGDLIGYEGNTGNTTKRLYGPERGYHIHFGVYDAEGFGVNPGKFSAQYGAYRVPFGYTYNPLDFL